MDLLNSDATNSNTYSTSDSFYSLETLPPLNFLADATLLFEGHSRRNETLNGGRDNGGGSRLIDNRHQRLQDIHGSTAGWSNHESFDLLINAAISEGFYDQNSRLSPTSLGDGLLYGPADVSNYVNLVDISQSTQQSSSVVFEDPLEKPPENQTSSHDGLVVCRIENNVLSIDLRQLFTQKLLNLTKSLKNKSTSGVTLVPVSLKFPNSNVNVRFRFDQLWPDDSMGSSKLEQSNPETNSARFQSVVIPNDDSLLVVSPVNEMISCQGGKKSWKCHLCENKVYKSRNNLELHFNRHLKRNPLVCSFCKKSFGQPGHLQSHVLRCHTPKSLICRGCGSNFSQRKILLNHMIKQCKVKLVGDESILRCHHCPDTIFESVRHLGEHFLKNFSHYFDSNEGGSKKLEPQSPPLEKEIAKIETKFICEVCNAVFSSSRRLNSHTGNVHMKKHVCKNCQKRFGKKIRLVQHETKCSSVKPGTI